MHYEELTTGFLNKIRTDWKDQDEDISSIYQNEIDIILEKSAYGSILDRTNFESTYFAVMDEGFVVGLMQIIVSGHGKKKTIKLLDILPAPNAREMSMEKRVNMVVTALVSLIEIGRLIENTGNHEVRVLKMYGRTKEVMGVLKILADDLFVALEEHELKVQFQGGWFEMKPIKQFMKIVESGQ